MLIGLSIVIAYLLGSISFALLVGKIGYGIDLREHGSGNLGGTNTFRVLGVKAGLIVTSADILKGTLAASLPYLFGLDIHPLIIGAFAIVGHTYPLFAGLKGGKAVATSAGVLLAYEPILFVSAIVVFFLILKISKYVSLSSILTAFFALVYSIFLGDLALIITLALITAFITYRHRANIKRIKEKKEPKITFM